MTTYQTTRFAMAGALSAAISSAAFAQVSSNSTPPPNLQALQAELDKSFQTSGAMRVYRDPKTGEFISENSETAAQGNVNDAVAGQRKPGSTASAKQSAPIAVKQHANGMKSATMGESGMRYAMAHRHADGSMQTDCVEDHSVSQALAKPTSQAKGEKNAR